MAPITVWEATPVPEIKAMLKSKLPPLKFSREEPAQAGGRAMAGRRLNPFRANPLRGRRVLFHFATGGVSHFLTRLGRSITFARVAGWNLGVVTEYHRPLGMLSFHQIFAPRAPIVQLARLEEKFPNLEIGSLRPDVEYPPDANAIPKIRDLSSGRTFPACLPPQTRKADFAVTTGDPAPDAPRPGRYAGWLAALDSLSLAPHFSQVVASRATILTAPYIAVHFRNSDRVGNLTATLEILRHKIDETGLNEVWWCTDDRRSADAARAAMPGVNIHCAQTYFLGSGKNLHRELEGVDSLRQLEATFADLFTLFEAKSYIPATESGWNRLVPLLRNERSTAMKFFGLSDRTSRSIPGPVSPGTSLHRLLDSGGNP